MKTKRQQLADLYTEYASDETAYFEFNSMGLGTGGWMRVGSTPSINSDLDRWRITTPYRKEIKEAFENGARIEFKAKDIGARWGETANPGWFWRTTDYRIKEVKPFSIYAVVTNTGGLATTSSNKEICRNHAARKGYRCIELVEKINE